MKNIKSTLKSINISDNLGEAYAGLVLSTKAHAKILNVDPSEALTLPGKLFNHLN